MAAAPPDAGVSDMAKIILETRGLTKHYGGVHALEDANFILHEGEHVAVVGDNGAGKSTFVRQVTAVEQRTAGEILFDGKERVGLETEITTGLVNVVPNPLQEWTRR